MKSTKILIVLVLALGLMVCLAKVSEAAPMGTAFTYQGRLMDANSAAEGLYDFQFKLYDSNDTSTGTQLGSAIDVNDLDIIDGHFVVELDFGSDVFDGDARWLEIGVRPGHLNDPNLYTILTPRYEITPVPYALQTRGLFVDNAGNVGIGTTNPSEKLDVAGNTKVNGDLKVTGAYRGNIGPNNGAPFPRPAYDSGWVAIDPGESVTLTHNIGGNVDNYLVNMKSKNADYGIHDTGGVGWWELTTNSIKVEAYFSVAQFRVCIWVYN